MPPLPSVVKSGFALTGRSIICPNRVCKSFHRAYDDFSPYAEWPSPARSQRPIVNIIRTMKEITTAATIRSRRVAFRVYLRICRCDISHSTAVTISPPTFLHDRFYHSIRPLDSATVDHSSSPPHPPFKKGGEGGFGGDIAQKAPSASLRGSGATEAIPSFFTPSRTFRLPRSLRSLAMTSQ